jgi:hypothetical protein
MGLPSQMPQGGPILAVIICHARAWFSPELDCNLLTISELPGLTWIFLVSLWGFKNLTTCATVT